MGPRPAARPCGHGRVTHYTLPFLWRIFWPQRKVTFLPSGTSLVLVLGGGAVVATVGKGNSAPVREGHISALSPPPPGPGLGTWSHRNRSRSCWGTASS